MPLGECHKTSQIMMMSSNGNIFRVTGPLCGEFTGPGEFPTQRPVMRSFDVFFDLCLSKRLSKQPWGWWFEVPLCSLWRHCNGLLNTGSGDDQELLMPYGITRPQWVNGSNPHHNITSFAFFTQITCQQLSIYDNVSPVSLCVIVSNNARQNS